MGASSVQGGSIAYRSTTGHTVGGTSAFTDVSSGNFLAGDVGSNITIKGAGTAGADYQGTITSINTSTSIVVSPNPATTVTNAQYFYGPGGAISSNWTTTIAVTLATSQAVGDVIGVGVNDDPAHSAPTAADSAGNTFTQRGSTITGVSDYQSLVWSVPVTHASGASANTITVTFQTLEAAFQEIFWRHFSGTGAYAQVAGASGTATAVSSGNFGSTVQTGATIWGFTAVDSRVTAAGSGYTATNDNGLGDIEEYQIVSSGGTFAVTATQSSNTTYGCVGVVFGAPAITRNAIFFGQD